jgi:hypothetical protein
MHALGCLCTLDSSISRREYPRRQSRRMAPSRRMVSGKRSRIAILTRASTEPAQDNALVIPIHRSRRRMEFMQHTRQRAVPEATRRTLEVRQGVLMETTLSVTDTASSSFITRDDFEDMKSAGLNAIRIPIGYWAVDVRPDEPYVTGQYPYLIQAVQWSSEFGFQVMIDLHGAPGSQNGQDNSGLIGPVLFPSNSSNTDRSLDVLRNLTEEFSQDIYGGAVTAIELLNEPRLDDDNFPMSQLKDFYDDGVEVVSSASVGSSPIDIVIHGQSTLSKQSTPSQIMQVLIQPQSQTPSGPPPTGRPTPLSPTPPNPNPNPNHNQPSSSTSTNTTPSPLSPTSPAPKSSPESAKPPTTSKISPPRPQHPTQLSLANSV